MSDVQSSSDDDDYHTCDEDDEQESGDPRAASPSSSSSDDGRDWLDYHHSSDDEEEEELDVLGAAAPVVAVKKETRQLYTSSITGLDQQVQQLLQSCDQPSTQLVPATSNQQAEDTLALAAGSASRGGSNTTLVQLNVTQQQFGDVTVEKATHINQNFGGSQNISKTATIYEGQKGNELSRADAILKRTVSHFQAWNQGMVKTAALGQVLDKLNSGTSWLTIKGNPGEGKTTVGYMSLEELHRCGRQVFEVRSPDEFTEVISACARPVIMLDDVFGNLEFDKSKWSNWEPVVSPLLKDQEHTSHEGEVKASKMNVTVILVGRDYVLNSASVDLGRLSDFLTSDKHAVSMDQSMKRSIEERRAIWESISRSSCVELDTMTVEKILRIKVPHGFPHVCRLFTTIYKEKKAICAIEFFNTPLDFLNKSISYLFKDTQKVMLFREMVKKEGKISKRELRKVDGTYKIIQIAKELVGSYLRLVDDCFVFDHPSVYDSVAFHMCSLDQEFVIQQCHLSFIHERIRLQLSEETKSTTTAESNLVVYVERSYEDDLAERFAAEITAQNFANVLSHQAFRDGTFVSKVMSKIKTPLKSLLHLEDGTFQLYRRTFLYFVPSSKSPELLKYIDNCPEIELTIGDEEDVLYGTCKHAASQVLTYLIDTRKGLNINVRLNQSFVAKNETPFVTAVETRDVQFVNQILSLDPDLNARDDKGKTPLHYLCQHGLVSVVAQVIDSGADIHDLDIWERSPLLYACEFNQLKVVKLLIERGARVDGKSLVEACIKGNIYIVELLLENATNLNADVSLTHALYAASQGGNMDIMKLLIHKGAQVTSDWSFPPLTAACEYNKLQAAQWLLQHGSNINARDMEGNTALHKAIVGGSKECVVMLLKEGAAVTIQNKHGDTALHVAAGFAYNEFVEVLLRAGATVNAQNKTGDTALHKAAWIGSKECINVLLRASALVYIQNTEGDTALQISATSGSKECLELLLKAGAAVNMQNKDGKTALHRSAKIGSKECVVSLLNVGGIVNLQNNEGDTPLHLCCTYITFFHNSQEYSAVAKTLIDNGADIHIHNKWGTPALHGDLMQLLQEDGYIKKAVLN